MNTVKKILQAIDAMQQRHTPTAFVVGVVKKYGDDNAGALTVQVTYSLFITVFPLILLLVTILSIVLAGDPSGRQRVLNTAIGEFPIIGQQLANNIHALDRSSAFGLVFGIVGLIYGSTGLAQAGLYAMEQIWDIPRSQRPNYLVRMLRSLIFLGVLASGLIVTTASAGFGTFGKHNILFGILSEFVALLVNAGLFVAAFRTLTPKQITTHSLLPGALVGSVAWTILQAIGGYVVGHDLKGASALYGMFGLVLGLIAWIYLGVELTLYSAEINTVMHHKLWPRSIAQPLSTDADRRSLELQSAEVQQLAKKT